MAAVGIAHERPEPDVLGSLGTDGQADINLAEKRLRVTEPDHVEAEILGQFRQLGQRAQIVRLQDDAESQLHRFLPDPNSCVTTDPVPVGAA